MEIRTVPPDAANTGWHGETMLDCTRLTIQYGAFSGAVWIRLRSEMQSWHGPSGWFMLARWFLEHRQFHQKEIPECVSLEGKGQAEFWAPFLADEQASAIEAIRIPVNYWRALNHWWQHNRWASLVVYAFILISAAGGIISIVRTLIDILSGT